MSILGCGYFARKPTRLYGNETLSHHPYILCHFANYAPTKLSTCTLKPTQTHQMNEQGTQHCSLHSLPHKRKSIFAMFSSNKSSQHKLHSNMPYRLNTAHALHSFYIQDRPYLPCSVAIRLPQHTVFIRIKHMQIK